MSKQYFEVSTQHPIDHIRKFISDGALAAKIKRENKTLYGELRADAVRLGLLAPSRRESVNAMFAKPRRTFSDAELKARLEFSEEECRAFYVASSTGKVSTLEGLKT